MFLLSFHIFKLASKIFRKQLYLKTKYRNRVQDNNIGNENISQAVCSTCVVQEQELQNESLIYLQCCENFDNLGRQYHEMLNIYFDSLVSKSDCTQEEENRPNIKCFEKFIPNFDELITNYKLEDQIMIFLDDIVKRLKNCSYTTLILPVEKKENNDNNNNLFIVSDTEYCIFKVQNVMKKNKKKVKKLKRIMQRHPSKNRHKSVDIRINPPHIKKTESITPQDQTFRIKKVVLSRFSPWINEEYIENFAHPLSVDDVEKEFSAILYVKYQNATHSTNQLNFIETVKQDLAVHLLESAFPEQIEVNYVRVKSITNYLRNLHAVFPVFPHQRLTDETYDTILLVSQAISNLLRHPYLSLYESLAQILQTTPSNIITLKNL